MAGPVVDADEPLTGAQKLARIAVAVAVVVVATVWIVAWFVVPKGAEDRFDDRTWSASAEAICVRSMAELDALPTARSFAAIKPKSEAIQRRADVGEQATTILETMVASLKQLRSDDRATSELTALWLADYDTYNQFRRQHIAKWRAGEDPRFSEPAVRGEPLSRGMDGFALANEMRSCQTPGDLG